MLTVESCRALAASDLLREAEASLDNQRVRFAASAATWTARADMLERTRHLSEGRKAAAVQPA